MAARDDTYGPLAVDDVVLDRYRVVEHVATGGHSEVFRGRDERLSRPVCIKVFSKFPDDPGVWRTAYEHFVQEAFALSRLTHPNTLRIYDFGHLTRSSGGAEKASRSVEDIGTPLQVQEFMNGGTLSQLVREKGAQPVGETLRLATAMCEALDEAHEVGLVHRDIKPQNILFAAAGGTRVAKLADFGIAKWREEAPPPTEPRVSVDFSERAGDTQVVAGIKMAMYSPSWAAPEQLAGKTIGPPADIYSLGVVIVYMLTGKAIFAEEDVNRGYRKRRRVADVLREAVAPLRLPDEAVGVLAHALAFDPDKRPRRASDLAHELIEAFEARTAEVQRASISLPDALAADALLPGAASMAAAALDGPARRPAPRADSDPGELPPPPEPPSRTGPIVVAAQPGAAAAATEATAVAVPAVPALPRPTAPAASPRPAASATTARHALPRRIIPVASAQWLGDRTLRFTPAVDGTVDLAVAAVRLRVTLMPDIDGRRPVHLKGLSCFVARRGGRPSAAVLLDGDGDFDLVSPRSQVIGGGRLSRGNPAAGHTVFHVGTETVAVGVDDCPDPLLIDFGPGADCHIIYPARRDDRARRGMRRTDSP